MKKISKSTLCLTDFILSEVELACKSETDGFTYYVMNTIYCVFCV